MPADTSPDADVVLPDPVADADRGLDVRFTAADTDVVVGVVDDVRVSDERRYAAVTVEDVEGTVYDVETHADPRVGWTTMVVHERRYGGQTEFVERGELESFEVIQPGVAPDRVAPGDTIEHVDGTRYRVVVAPWEREYDANILGYAIEDSRSNVVEKLKPENLLAATHETPPTAPSTDERDGNRGGQRDAE